MQTRMNNFNNITHIIISREAEFYVWQHCKQAQVHSVYLLYSLQIFIQETFSSKQFLVLSFATDASLLCVCMNVCLVKKFDNVLFSPYTMWIMTKIKQHQQELKLVNDIVVATIIAFVWLFWRVFLFILRDSEKL